MGCGFCFGPRQKPVRAEQVDGKPARSDAGSDKQLQHSDKPSKPASAVEKKEALLPSASAGGDAAPAIAAQTFTFRELAAATKNFRAESLLGEGGFGRVYKGRLESTGQEVAVKQLDRNGLQGNREFLVEVLMLSLLHHPNLVNLIGYCADGDQRLLVYEFMPLGCLEQHLHDIPPEKAPLEWNTRMKIAAGAARGLEYLHDTASPPVIYRDFKSSNILLDKEFHPKLSDFGLAKLGPTGDKTHVSTRVMGTYGYCAPEYAMTGQLTLKSDVYSFGVVLLELITGRKAIDNTRPPGEHNLVAWARPQFRDKKNFPAMADPALQCRYPQRGLYQALAVAAMCLQEQAATRPLIGDVVTALNYLANQTYDPGAHPLTSRPAAAAAGKKEKKAAHNGLHAAAAACAQAAPPPPGGGPSVAGGGTSVAGGGASVAAAAAPGEVARVATKRSSGRSSARSSPREGRDEEGSGGGGGGESTSPGGAQSNRIFREFRVLDNDRERAVAEARTWGESYRSDKRRQGNGESAAAAAAASSNEAG